LSIADDAIRYRICAAPRATQSKSSRIDASCGRFRKVASLDLMTDRLPIKMLHDRVLVREPREEGERKSSGGILIPATAQVAKRLIWAEVLAVGNHVRALQVGDRVLFSPDDRHEVEIAGDEYLLLRERDVHAVAAERNDENTGLYL
jgi:chaperonin GroES